MVLTGGKLITFTQAGTESDLQHILNLQKANLPDALSDDEIHTQGFVTLSHNLGLLRKMNDIEKHVIAKDNNMVIGYLLAMTEQSKNDIPALKPMFEAFDSHFYKYKKVSDYNFLIVGQVCIHKDYRGKGILDELYKEYKNQYAGKYDFAITEIAASNPRSINAHKRIGFEEIFSYESPDKTKWIVVVWDWKTNPS